MPAEFFRGDFDNTGDDNGESLTKFWVNKKARPPTPSLVFPVTRLYFQLNVFIKFGKIAKIPFFSIEPYANEMPDRHSCAFWRVALKNASEPPQMP